MLSLTERLDPHQRHHRVARDGLLESHSRLAFEDYLRRLGAGDVTEANVVNPRYLRAVDELVATLPLDALKTYLKWHWIREAAPFLSASFIREHDHFHQQVLGGQRATQPREKQCTRFVEMDLSHPVGQLSPGSGKTGSPGRERTWSATPGS
jgi:predicted metalloendopeptidase